MLYSCLYIHLSVNILTFGLNIIKKTESSIYLKHYKTVHVDKMLALVTLTLENEDKVIFLHKNLYVYNVIIVITAK